MDIFKLFAQLDPTQDRYLPKSVELSNIRQFPFTKYSSLSTLLFAASLVCFVATSAKAKKPFEAYSTTPSTSNNYSYTGTNDNRDYTFGNGVDLNLDTITAGGGIIYTPRELADQIFIRRVDNSLVSGERCNIFLEYSNTGTGDINSASTFPRDNSDNCSIAEVLKDLVINRGVLDTFSNSASGDIEKPNNIERIDFVYTSGIVAPSNSADLEEAGHIVMEKSGNNPTKVAAITAIDASGNPTAFGSTFVTINSSDYGKTGAGIRNNFLFDPSTSGGITNPEYRDDRSEQIGGVLITLDDFDIGAGDTYYGFAMFATDVPDNANLLQPENFPLNTPHGSGNTGGADWQGGMGGFWSSLPPEVDYGDAPDTYGTDATAGNSGGDLAGASHVITSSLFLGATVPDSESDGFVDGTDNHGNATDDDQTSDTGNGDDEDNFTLPTLTEGNTSYTIPAANLTATNNTGKTATLHGWIDFNKNGTFEAAEHASATVNNGTNGASPSADLNWNNIVVGAAGDTYARFRLTTDIAIDDTTPSGGAVDGEVEDYQIAIALSPSNSLPDSTPATPTTLSCGSLPFGNFVPDRTHFETNSNGQKKYSVDTVWTATATDGTTATLRTTKVNNNSGNLTFTGADPDAFFVEFVDPTTGFQSPRLSEREGEIGDSWDLTLEYSRPISARFLAGDIDSLQTNVAQFKDLLTVEGFLNSTSVAPDNIYVGSILEAVPQGNGYLFQDQGAFGPNPGESERSNRIVADFETLFVDQIRLNYGVGASLAGVGTQSIVMTSGMSAGCNISGTVFEDSNGNDLLNPNEPLLDTVAVSAYLDDGDGVFDQNSDLLIATQDTATGEYEFNSLVENNDYWIVVDQSDTDLDGYQYDGGNVELTQVNPRLISLVDNHVDGVNFPFAIANPNQTIKETSSCQALGGTLSGNNLFTPLDNGTFGFENGDPDQSPTVDPYPGIVSGGDFKYFYDVDHGDYGYVANDQTRRNTFQHENITDPVYGVTGRFFASDPDVDTPTLTTTLTGLTPNQFYEYSFWAANSEPNPPSSNDVSTIVNGTEIYNTGDLPTFPETLEWKKHTVSFTNGASNSITIDLASNKIGPGGNDFYLDNIELRSCNFTVDYGDAPISYGDAIQTTIPSSPTIYLGTVAPDGENETSLGGDNGVGADGDDDPNSGIDDEDAFTTLRDVSPSGTYDLNDIPVSNTSGADVTLHAWIDFNQDGKFSALEYQSVVVANGDNTADLSWTVPNNTTAGDTYARFRITPDVLLVDDPNTTDVDERSQDAAVNGEVEDYQIAIASASLCPAAKADLWFANDESGSVFPAEFDNALDFIYQISDGFVYDDATGIKAGITGWTELPNSMEIVMPITESFGDSEDFGLLSTNNITLNNNTKGIRELYASKQNSSSGTRLDYATNYLADLITTGNGKRTGVPQVAIMLTDADSSFINDTAQGGFFSWINEANLLRSAGAEIVLILIDEAATAYNSNPISKFIIDTVVGTEGKVITVPNYADAANATLGYIETTSQAICDLATPVATDPGLLLVKRITAINPGQPGEIQFNDFVDDPNTTHDNHPLWPDSDEDPSSNTNLYLRGVIDGGRVKPDDEVEYTIYFLSNGDEDALEVNICDVVPNHLTYVKDAYGSEIGIGLGFDPTVVQFSPNKYLSNLLNDDEGDFYGVGTAPPTNFCKKIDSNNNLVTVDGTNNNNGAIIVRPAASLPSAISPGQPASSYGFIRFRGKVK